MINRYAISEGALIQAPVYESHKRGKNWLAKIHKDPSSPGGLGRDFLPQAKGAYYYIVAGKLERGDVVEFGADYYSAGGRKTADRVYAKVTAITEEYLEIDEYKTKTEAFAAELPEVEQCGNDALDKFIGVAEKTVEELLAFITEQEETITVLKRQLEDALSRIPFSDPINERTNADD